MSISMVGTLQSQFNPFDGNYLVEILEATARAWSRMRHPSVNELEDQITFRIAGRIAHDPLFAEIPYDVIPQCWLLGPDGETLGRIDIRFKHRFSQRDYFAFEAKRLHVTYPSGSFSTEYPTYTGDAGMMAFVEGHYSKGFAAGGMLGYVMDARTDRAYAGLGKRINARRANLKLKNNSSLRKSAHSHIAAQAVATTHLAETEHQLATHDLRLYHLVLPVQPNYQGVTLQ